IPSYSFFFQAEDGIRDFHVTGVQTCALPIWHIPQGARVLDVGCGDGELMAALRAEKGVDARGIEIDPEAVEKCVARGLSAVQGDANRDLAEYPDDAFDYAILSRSEEHTSELQSRENLVCRLLLE